MTGADGIFALVADMENVLHEVVAYADALARCVDDPNAEPNTVVFLAFEMEGRARALRDRWTALHSACVQARDFAKSRTVEIAN